MSVADTLGDRMKNGATNVLIEPQTLPKCARVGSMTAPSEVCLASIFQGETSEF